MKDFERLAALVTGGATGIGAATAALLGDGGARVAVLAEPPVRLDDRHGAWRGRRLGDPAAPLLTLG